MLKDILVVQPGENQARAVIADRSVLCIADLLIDDHRPDDQDDGDAELNRYQDLPQCGSRLTPTSMNGAFEHFHRPETRQVKGGIAAGDQSGDYGKCDA